MEVSIPFDITEMLVLTFVHLDPRHQLVLQPGHVHDDRG